MWHNILLFYLALTLTCSPLTNASNIKSLKTNFTKITELPSLNLTQSTLKQISSYTQLNKSSDYYLVISVLNDLNLLDYYLKNLPKNLTSTQSPLKQDGNNKTNTKETFFTKLSVFYSSEDSLTCAEVPYNSSTVKCIDTILENKLKNKLSSLYEIDLQPLFVDRIKMICLTDLESEGKYKCRFPIMNITGRKKLIWRLLLVGKVASVEPRSSRVLNGSDVSNVEMQTRSEMNEAVSSHQTQIKADLLTISRPIDRILDFMTANRIILGIALIFAVGLTILANTVLCVILRKRKIKPLSIKSMSLNNRLLQNYLDVSLVSDGKISSNSISKSTAHPKPTPKIPTPLRSSTSVEQNYAASTNASQILRTSLDKNSSKYHSNLELNRTTNPYNSLSCISSEKLDSCSVGKTKKLKYCVSSVGTQADISRDYCLRSHSMMQPKTTPYYSNKKSVYEDSESQIMCIEMDKNNMTLNRTVNEDYISVADLYQLANKHLDHSASIKVNDYSAFKNSLNFQLQAAKAAAIAENKDVNESVLANESNQELSSSVKLTRSLTSTTKTTKATHGIRTASTCSRRSSKLIKSIEEMARVSLDEVYEESSASSLAPYSSVSMFSERSRNKRVGDAEISSSDQICAWQIESIIEPNNQKTTAWTTLNETEGSKYHSHSLHDPSTSSKNIFPNDVYMSIAPCDDSRLKPITPLTSTRPTAPTDLNEITYLTRLQDSSSNSDYAEAAKEQQKDYYLKPKDVMIKNAGNECMLSEGTNLSEKNSELWTTVSVSTSSPSISSLNDESKNAICSDLQEKLTKRNSSISDNQVRPVKILSGTSNQQYQKLYKLNKNTSKLVTKNL